MIFSRFRILQTAAVLGLGAALLSVLVVRRATARFEQTLEGVAPHLMRYAAADSQTPPQLLQVNGTSFFVSTGVAKASLHEVVEHFAGLCRRGGAGLAQWASGSGMGVEPTSAERAGVLDGVFHLESERQGVVACLDSGKEESSFAGFMARVQGFARTGDFAMLGGLRYVVVEPGEMRSVFVTLWSEGPLRLGQMFPERGDAPGEDMSELVRPADARRLLSATHRGTSASIAAYAVSLPVAELRAFYTRQLSSGGFALLAGRDPGSRFVVAQRGLVMLSLAFGEETRGSIVVLSRSEGGASDALFARAQEEP